MQHICISKLIIKDLYQSTLLLMVVVEMSFIYALLRRVDLDFVNIFVGAFIKHD